MKFAFVMTNLLDLWAEPKYNCERVSQLFFGEPIRLLGNKKGYLLVAQADGYRGWLDERFCRIIGSNEYSKMVKSIRSVVVSMKAVLRDSAGHSAAPYYLPYGARLRTRKLSGGNSRILLPINGGLMIKTSQLRSITKTMRRSATGGKIVVEARKFLGLPYLWGGVSSTGVDCSGLVQTVFLTLGIDLPRDTKDQIRCGKDVDRYNVKSGDLLFFKRHVGIAIDRDRMIHSSIGGGGVRENSLRPGTQNYREDLDLEFKTARRLL